MRRPVSRVRAGASTLQASLPAPTGGWNARDALHAMPAGDAIILENWFPEADRVTVRPGCAVHASGMGDGAVETLAVWQGPGGAKLIAAAEGELYDVTGITQAITSSATYGSDRWQIVNFKGRLFGVNGTDTPWHYDGTSLGNTAWSGSSLDPRNLIQIEVFKERLFFAEEGSASFWYGGIGAVTGALTEFDLGQIARAGGKLQAIGTWSLDAGDGLDDFLVCVMSTGEIVIYQGTDPGDVNAWSKVGSYQAAPPMGRRCLTKIGGDLIVLTEDGYFPVSLIAQGWTIDRIVKDTAWGKIAPAVRRAADAYRDNWGWQASPVLPSGKVYFNVPVSSQRFDQHVFNTQTGAWALASGINARVWAALRGDAYFGGAGGTVYVHRGPSDAGNKISAHAKTAFSYLGSPGAQKRFTSIRPLLVSEGDVTGVSVGCDTDFSDRRAVLTPTTLENTGTTAWGSKWGSPWGDVTKPTRQRVSVAGHGRAAALRLQVQVDRQSLDWHATDFTAELGGNR